MLSFPLSAHTRARFTCSGEGGRLPAHRSPFPCVHAQPCTLPTPDWLSPPPAHLISFHGRALGAQSWAGVCSKNNCPMWWMGRHLRSFSCLSVGAWIMLGSDILLTQALLFPPELSYHPVGALARTGFQFSKPPRGSTPPSTDIRESCRQRWREASGTSPGEAGMCRGRYVSTLTSPREAQDTRHSGYAP